MSGKIKKIKLDFEVDELTNCIVNTSTKEQFQTVIEPINLFDLKKIKYQNWAFDWVNENSKNDRKIFKLFIVGNPKIIHGLISLSDKSDHVQMNLIENAKHNIGKNKTYDGVAGNLVAFACKTSFELGYEGFLLFTAKSKLIPHYKKMLNAEIIKGNDLMINSKNSLSLINKYFPDYEIK